MNAKPEDLMPPEPPTSPGSPPASRPLWLGAVALGCLAVGAGLFWWLRAPAVPSQSDLPPQTGETSRYLDGPPLFEDVTQRTGIAFTYRNGQEANYYAILESLGGGVALIDYDGDGLLDVFVTGGGYFGGKDGKEIKGYPCRLYKNLGNWKFRDVTHQVGLDRYGTDKDGKARPAFYTHGCAVADYDRDGWPDLLVTGWGRVALYHNEPVNPKDPSKGRRFREVSREAGLTDRAWTTSAAWADLNGDGYPDLYLCQYVNWDLKRNNPPCPGYTAEFVRDVCSPRQFKGLPHLLYRNNGDGTFTNITREAGLNVPGKKDADGRQVELGKGLGVVAVDTGNRGRADLYVCNDTVDNFLYLNRTRRGFFGRPVRLEEAGLALGVAEDSNATPNGSMGVAAGDYDRSGNASLFVTNYEDEMHALYQNLGQERYSFATQRTGIVAIGQKYVGFGTAFVDLFNRGWEDLVIANGHVIRHPAAAGVKQRPVLFLNEAGRRFEVLTPRGGPYFQTDHVGRGLAAGDLDNDGRTDLVVSHVNEPVAILRNVATDGGRRNHWLGLELAGKGHRDLAGSRVVVEVGGTRRTRFAQGGGSYLSSGDRRHLFGLGADDKVGRVTVVWSWGETQTWDGKQFRADRYWRLVEGKPDAEPCVARASRGR